jgi:hypothetical protein
MMQRAIGPASNRNRQLMIPTHSVVIKVASGFRHGQAFVSMGYIADPPHEALGTLDTLASGGDYKKKAIQAIQANVQASSRLGAEARGFAINTTILLLQIRAESITCQTVRLVLDEERQCGCTSCT